MRQDRRHSLSSPHRAVTRPIWLGFLVLWPRPAGADGGIASVGSLLPFYLALWSVGLGLFVWFSYSLYLLSRIRGDAAHRDPKVYSILSGVLVFVVFSVGVVLGPMTSPIVGLGAFASSALVGVATGFIVSRARRANQG